jgi:hypothetical protein
MKSSMTSKIPLLTQQEIERHYFEMFRSAYPLPPGTVVYGDKPDVTITGALRRFPEMPHRCSPEMTQAF